MSVRTKKLGIEGENLAVEYLQFAGYEVITKNYRAGREAEIDIIAKSNDVLIFVEVKTRSNDKCGTPAESVDIRKQKKIITAAMKYLQENNLFDNACRFDVIEIYAKSGKNMSNWKVHHIKNAFEIN